MGLEKVVIAKEAHMEVNVGEEVSPDGDGDIFEAPVEQADIKRILPTPAMPTPSEVQQHREDHIPYQSWCDQCVEGRGREMGHSSVDMASRPIATIAFDYLFVNDKRVVFAQ